MIKNNDMSESNLYYAYARISWGKEQRNRNLSIPSQVDQVNYYVRSKPEIEVVKVYKEVHSAFKGNRPVFNQMLKDIKDHKNIKGLIVMKWDRISRNPDDYLKLQNIRGASNPIDIISVTEPMISSYLGRYMVRDLQNRSILYSEELSFRVKIWQRKKMQLGGYSYMAPFGYKNLNGYLVEDNIGRKVEIVKFIFETYSTGHIWFKDLAKLIRKKFKLESFSWRKIDHIIWNTVYYGIATRKRHLNSDEYIFFWAEKPWEFTEKYELTNIVPLITEDIFERCQQVRKLKQPHKYARTGLIKYPKIFQCICGRKLRRYDKKHTFRYLACWKEVNSVHTVPCSERHTPLGCIEKDLINIIEGIIPPKKVRDSLIAEAGNIMTSFSKDNNYRVADNLTRNNLLKQKLQELSESYASWRISLETFSLSADQINKGIHSLNQEIRKMENSGEYLTARRKAIRFIEILGEYSKIIEKNKQNIWNSSRVYPIIFKATGNLVIWNRNIRSYQLNQPFTFLQVPDFHTNRKAQDSNLRYLAVRTVSNGVL